MPNLIWQGDNIALGGCEAGPAYVLLSDTSGHMYRASVEQTLSLADQIDEYGLRRIATGLKFAADTGCLAVCDLAAWETSNLSAAEMH